MTDKCAKKIQDYLIERRESTSARKWMTDKAWKVIDDAAWQNNPYNYPSEAQHF
jgi:hypothetical protein